MDKGVNEKAPLPLTKVKRENFDEEIKEYAETAMNELLGWYGYGAARDEVKTTVNCHSNSNSNSSDPDSPRYTEGCGWCGKPVEGSTGLSAGTNTFCSELCFSQSRRANFKKNKTCDWCRHVRHTVSYVDFQDGASQLQFCSDKCLNQYKMHIFCRETRAHLEMHPHLPVDDSGTGLITPELWMKNCKSPDSKSSSPPDSPKQQTDLPQTSPLPLITVAHPSKLMAPNVEPHEMNRRMRSKPQRKQRKRCPSTVTCSNFVKAHPEVPQDLRIRHSPVNCVDNHQAREAVNPPMERIPNPYFYHQPPYPPDPRIPHPAFMNRLPTPPPLPPKQPTLSSGVLPPVTVLVPYPVLVPVPLPIPIPLPLKSFLQAEQTRRALDSSKNGSSIAEIPAKPVAQQNGNSSQDADDCVVTGDDHEEVKEVTQNGITRPLRKRKRVVDPKARVLLKNKKPLST